MPASRDQTQRPTFVFTNLYQVYKKGFENAKAAVVSSGPGVVKGQILGGMKSIEPKLEVLETFEKNLKALDSIQERLRFLLQELEEYTKK